MRKVPFRLFLLCFVAVMNFVPFLATAQVPDKMWYVWRKTGDCSMTRNDWLTVAQDSPGYGWQLCNGSKFHFTQLGAQQEMDILKVVQCNADTPNCPRFQNDCCDVTIWENSQTGQQTITSGDSPGFGFQYSKFNSPTQCCEEAELAIGIVGNCRGTQLSDGVIAVFNGPGAFVNQVTGAPISPATLPAASATLTTPGQPPITVDLPPGIEIETIPEDEGDGTPGWSPGTGIETQPPPPPTTGAGSCSAADSEAFANMTGSWHWYRMNVTIGGSCENASGGFDVREWCEGVDEPEQDAQGNPIQRAPKVHGTFKGRMEGGSLKVNWDQPASPNHGAENGTGSCYLGSDGLSCSGFGCSGDLKKQ